MNKKTYLRLERIICLLIITAFLFSMLGCSQEKPRGTATPSNSDILSETVRDYVANPPSEKCSIEKIGDNYYLFIEDIEYYENRGSDGSLGATFDSFEEFRDALVNCKLSRSGIEDAAQDFERDKIGIKICDPNNIYVPSVPENLKMVQITWFGESYSYGFSTEQGEDSNLEIYVRYFPKDRLSSLYEANKKEHSSYSFYTLENEEKKIKVQEGKFGINMYVFEKEIGYIITLGYSDITPVEEWRPSDEWLLSIGMTKYVEPEEAE